MHDYPGEILDETYIAVDFTACDLRGAVLAGTFVDCTFNATFYEAERPGHFVNCEVRG